jgi:hypothetical protein
MNDKYGGSTTPSGKGDDRNYRAPLMPTHSSQLLIGRYRLATLLSRARQSDPPR